MTLTTISGLDQARAALGAIGQDHVLRFWDRLSESARAALLAQIASLDIAHLPSLVDRYVRSKEAFALPRSVAPAKCYSLGGPWDRAAYKSKGEALLRAGKIAAFTVAGGQGTRLGFDGPKGAFPGGAVTGKPLFACLADWLTAARQRYGRAVPWYIMTSPLNHDETIALFERHGYFGQKQSDVMFFSQGTLPSLDMKTGKLLLAEVGEIATNPDGHGGSLRALEASGALADMARRGVEHISYVQIDNPLARVVDPVFIGLHASAPDSSGEMSSKMVAKSDPAEKVGVFCLCDGKTQVIEYSDLPKDLMEQRDAGGKLKFNAGSIAIHMIGVGFVEGLTRGGDFALPLHRAEKKVPFIDPATGKLVKPEAANAVKLEAFVFDALPLAKSSIVVETDRIEEFAPIKNAEGNDSPTTCARIQTERAARWLEGAGVKIPRDATGAAQCTLELNPMTAMFGEDLSAAKPRLPKAVEPGARVAL
jgi:UDP-N-acetylglucosamine/UDP-N-acetylgalactosamine diphosphorylase